MSSVQPPTFPDEAELAPARILDDHIVLESRPGHYDHCGGFSEVFIGRCNMPSGEVKRVALKIFRGAHTNPDLLDRTRRRINRESKVWIRLQHPNILPFYGVYRSRDLPSPALVSPYCENSTALAYLSTTLNVNRMKVVYEVASGLSYLHREKVIHGDFKTSNVLIGPRGQAQICDFGCSKIMGHAGYTTGLPQVYRFMAPELMATQGETDPRLSQEADVYAFAMVALQLLTDKIPFCHLIQDAQVIIALHQRQRPLRERYTPPNLPDWIWKLLEECWQQDANRRPTMAEVYQRLTPQRVN